MKNDTPNPLDKQRIISRGSALGFSVAGGSVVLFVAVYLVLGKLGVDRIPRVMLAVCLPPGITAAGFGSYILFAKPGKKPDQ